MQVIFDVLAHLVTDHFDGNTTGVYPLVRLYQQWLGGRLLASEASALPVEVPNQ